MDYLQLKLLAASNPNLFVTIKRTIEYTGPLNDIVSGLDKRALQGIRKFGNTLYSESFSNEITIAPMVHKEYKDDEHD